MQYISKDAINVYLVPKYNTVFRILRAAASCATTGSWTMEEWSAALSAHILVIIWLYIDSERHLKSVPNTTPQ